MDKGQMIDVEKVILTSTSLNTFRTNRGTSPTSMPVSEVEAWLDANPKKRNKHNDIQLTRKGESHQPAFSFGQTIRAITNPSEIRKARAKAQKEHQKALLNLSAAHNCRACIKCSEIKPLDDMHFYRNANKSFAGQCIECAKKYNKAYKAKKRAEKQKP